MSFSLLLNFACSLYMTGLIWFVQVVHYPLFDRVGPQNFALYSRDHAARTVFVTAPIMLLELALSGWLLLERPRDVPPVWLWSLAAMNLALFASTFLLQVPLHEKLQSGYSRDAIQALVASNWIRTLLWSLRSVALGYFVWRSGR
ncbi:MAG: hypothetical protein OHK0021_07170 [Bryobacter sp.]